MEEETNTNDDCVPKRRERANCHESGRSKSLRLQPALPLVPARLRRGLPEA